jgi:hypothetical protein
MTGGTAKSVLNEFFEVEDRASGFIAKCPDCEVRFAVKVKADKVADGYVRLLMSHADEEHLTFEKDESVQVWLSESANPFQKALAKAGALADRRAYKILNCDVPSELRFVSATVRMPFGGFWQLLQTRGPSTSFGWRLTALRMTLRNIGIKQSW